MKDIIVIMLLAILLTSCGTTTEPNTNLDRPTELGVECNYIQEVNLSWNYNNGDEISFLMAVGVSTTIMFPIIVRLA